MEEPNDDYQEDSAPPSHELKAYKALLSTASAIHRKEYDSICLRVTNALNKIKIAKKITPELREEIRVLKIGVDAQCISVAGEVLSFPLILCYDDHLILATSMTPLVHCTILHIT
jgi:pyruvate/oxaloacetate carboxyltransferase